MFYCAMVESEIPIAGRRIVGFGASTFVQAAFAEQELTDPRPGLNTRIIASIASGHPVILSEAELKASLEYSGTWSALSTSLCQLATAHLDARTGFRSTKDTGGKFSRIARGIPD